MEHKIDIICYTDKKMISMSVNDSMFKRLMEQITEMQMRLIKQGANSRLERSKK